MTKEMDPAVKQTDAMGRFLAGIESPDVTRPIVTDRFPEACVIIASC